MGIMRDSLRFVIGTARIVTHGKPAYFAWVGFLLVLIVQGIGAYLHQLQRGLIMTSMRDQLSWGFYIGNFTFLVGVAAAAIMLVVPAYVYNWKPIKEIAIFGELLAISAIAMCILFVLVDMGHPERLWHIIPGLGRPNFPSSLLVWDSFVLNIYLVVNLVVVTSMLFAAFMRRDYNHKLVIPLVLFSIPAAVAIHTVTAFLYNGMASRPFWNSAILAPRFLASAFCSGPAVLLILLQVLRKTTAFEILDDAIHKIAELMAYAMFVNLFLLGAELFKEFYSNTEHLVHTKYMLFGLHGHLSPVAPFTWLSLIFGISAFVLFLVPATRKNPVTMNIGCAMIYISVYIEKGVGLIVPGYTPDVLGEIYEYFPSHTEFRVSMAVFAVGFLLFTVMVKVAVAILFEHFTVDTMATVAASGPGAVPARTV